MQPGVNMANAEIPLQASQPSQAAQARPRLGVDLVERYELIKQDQGMIAATKWAVELPQAEWRALMEAKQTGLKA